MDNRDMSTAAYRPGDRVRHYGQQYPAAQNGTATVLAVEPQSDGTFEYQVQRDKPFMPDWSNEPTWWASYMTLPAVLLSSEQCPVADCPGQGRHGHDAQAHIVTA